MLEPADLCVTGAVLESRQTGSDRNSKRFTGFPATARGTASDNDQYSDLLALTGTLSPVCSSQAAEPKGGQ